MCLAYWEGVPFILYPIPWLLPCSAGEGLMVFLALGRTLQDAEV